MVYGRYNEVVNGDYNGYKPTNITGDSILYMTGHLFVFTIHFYWCPILTHTHVHAAKMNWSWETMVQIRLQCSLNQNHPLKILRNWASKRF